MNTFVCCNQCANIFMNNTMRFVVIALAALLTLSFAESPQKIRRVVADNDYRLVFCDEFNLPNGSQPDSTKWSRCKRYDSMWNRWISSSKDVVYINNGKLVCRAIPNRNEPNDTAKMLTGAIESIRKFSFQYGRVDVKLKTNMLRGNFPAAWMKPEVIDPNKYGEIDIFEGNGDLKIAQQTIHNHMSTVLKKDFEQREFKTKMLVNEWHVYSLVWTPTELFFLIDNKVTGAFYKSHDEKILEQGQWTFDRPFYLILNQSVGDGRFECLTVDTSKIYETQIDWVRVYKK